ncbi:FAD-dependent oxidoreductase [Methylobacterium trifolii]|uniref:Ferredoxin--NADP reductase n=1 Tax=Methylobacterium trifolii TaxID=1003092 RepID=A0ABQ4U606_9HYPH|nr:FAD-dependent oxidoreductase [Methylobacterium trifolii]GJE62292.1 Ferredoxin--NADP reductase [Methylobacterium trifolii]
MTLSEIIRYDVIILGAGVTGLTTADVLANRGLKVCLIDDYPEPGGNHLSWTIDSFTFDIGAIFFWTDNPMFKVFPGMRSLCLPIDYRVEKISRRAKVVAYPFDIRKELLFRSPLYVMQVFFQIARQRLSFTRRVSSVRDFIRYYLGETLLQDTGLAEYFTRFYGIPPQDISYDFATTRMGWISNNASIRSRVKRWGARRQVGQHGTALARPKRGFAELYRVAVAQLVAKNVTIILDAGLSRTTVQPAGFSVTTRDVTVSGARLISTIPLARTLTLLGLDSEIAPPSSNLTTLFCKFRGDRNFESVVLYNFHSEGLWKRLTVHSDYYGMSEGWQYLSVEITDRAGNCPPGPLFEDFQRSVSAVGLFDGDLVLVDSIRTAFAYPVYDMTAAAKRDASMSLLDGLGIELLGRQGAFKYMASSKVAVDNVLRSI